MMRSLATIVLPVLLTLSMSTAASADQIDQFSTAGPRPALTFERMQAQDFDIPIATEVVSVGGVFPSLYLFIGQTDSVRLFDKVLDAKCNLSEVANSPTATLRARLEALWKLFNAYGTHHQADRQKLVLKQIIAMEENAGIISPGAYRVAEQLCFDGGDFAQWSYTGVGLMRMYSNPDCGPGPSPFNLP